MVREPLLMHGLEFRFAGDARPAIGDVVTVTTGPRSLTRDEPPDDVAMRCDVDGWTIVYTLRTGDGWTFVYPGLMEIDISADATAVCFRLHPDTDERYADIMLVGAVSALCCLIRGDAALHASAVELDGSVIAFAGPSGQGKSTTATLAAIAGAPVFSDDLVRICPGTPSIAHRGATESRLRDSASQLAELAAATVGSRVTADGRTGLSFPVSSLATAPLRAIVLPRPSAEATRVIIEPLAGLEAFKELHACLRLVGWRDHEMLKRGFDDIGDLLDHVPIVRARIPWGAPYRLEHGQALLEALSEV